MADPALPPFDPLVHSPAKLKVLLLLASAGTLTFTRLAKDAGLTAGNLASHLKPLVQAGYVEQVPGFIELRPRVRYTLSDQGRGALAEYRAALEAAIRAIEGTTQREDDGGGMNTRSP